MLEEALILFIANWFADHAARALFIGSGAGLSGVEAPAEATRQLDLLASASRTDLD